MKTVLLTGFEPFDGAAINPSWEAVRQLDGWVGDGFKVVARLLPCVFGRAAEACSPSSTKSSPTSSIAVGQAGGRPEISIERIAINVDDARFVDNAGQQPVDLPIVDGGPAAYFTTLPIKAMVAAMREQGLKAGVSQTAGTFVCNHVFYALDAPPERAAGEGGLHPRALPARAGGSVAGADAGDGAGGDRGGTCAWRSRWRWRWRPMWRWPAAPRIDCQAARPFCRTSATSSFMSSPRSVASACSCLTRSPLSLTANGTSPRARSRSRCSRRSSGAASALPKDDPRGPAWFISFLASCLARSVFFMIVLPQVFKTAF
jgi:pyroglutamyl-peptidase